MTLNDRRPSALLVALLMATSGSALANEALARKNECFACHSVANPVVGPAYRAIAAKYAGQADAEDQLVRSIREGSSGKWGDIPMPPHPKLSEQDAHRLAKWILALPK